MKFLKNILSFSIPLFIVLITFTIYSSIVTVVSDYKKIIINDYTIIVVSSTPLLKERIDDIDDINLKKIELLDRKKIIDNMKNRLSESSLKLLKDKLPFFYKIHLEDYPTISQLNIIKSNLKKIKTISKVETFASDHNKIYSLLLFIEQIISILLIFLSIFVILILSKQVSIWFFEHHQRISIIQLHGGSIWYSALPIIKIAFLSSLISSSITIILNIIIKNNVQMILSSEIISIIPDINNIEIIVLQIILMSFVLSLLSIIGVLFKYKF
ncbi:Cell division protein FtsX [hydrothermal vent metagenome]|uniref:Cell division protein FtsX n=1 Tax=hydrothermal vent metagenome TaxID=652676 RepID=A0A3B1E6Q7_9ZZZZ